MTCRYEGIVMFFFCCPSLHAFIFATSCCPALPNTSWCVRSGSEAQRAEQHAGSLQATTTHPALRGRRRPLSVLQHPHPWARVLPHPQTGETHQEETVNRRALKSWKLKKTVGRGGLRHFCGFHLLILHSVIEGNYRRRKKLTEFFWRSWCWIVKKLPQPFLAVVTYAVHFCSFPPRCSWH